MWKKKKDIGIENSIIVPVVETIRQLVDYEKKQVEEKIRKMTEMGMIKKRDQDNG